MTFEAPVQHDEAVAGLWQAARDGRLAHALLVRGAKGIGKFKALQWLALGLLCEAGPGEPCMTCGACKRVMSGNHPDLFALDVASEGEEQIKVGRVAARDDDEPTQSIASFLSLRAHEGGWRIVLVREAERMNEAAQNAFLKTLEEPSARTLLALESGSPSQLLTTVRSRVVAVDLDPLPVDATTRILVAGGMSDETARRYARISGGAPGRALELERQAGLELRDLIVQLAHGQSDAAAVTRAVWDVDGEFGGKTAAAGSRARARAFLDVGLELWLDAERLAAGLAPDALAHGDVVAPLAAAPSVARHSCMEEWLTARQDVQLNMTPEALVDRAALALEATCAPR